ncbi:Hypothetical protein CINCED_3A004075 [Cinara cedri]|uniref:Bromo domain-containing protein n=2 Tax=Cinara cedri TaxID=506608 RepID=A0A5E4M433_9HEMI|nr:Hypothetical protein CINCED_3A004075 [Cinara cedri]
MRETATDDTQQYSVRLTLAAVAAAASHNMASNSDAPDSIYKWIDRKPLTEAITWTSREKFWLITAICHYGIHDWKSVAQVVRNSGEPYRPREWYTTKSCERQFKIIVSNYSKEMKLPFNDMLRHIAECLKFDYIKDANKSKDNLKAKYCSLFNMLNRVKQGNLSRQEIVNLYCHARRNEVESKQYMDQLMNRQNASLATENLNSSLSEEPIKWNTPSAPLLTSLLRSRNTIPANRTVTTITSLLQSPGGTSRTRSGKLLPLSTSVRTQGTPTLSKLLEAPANPYIPSPTQSVQKTKPIDVVEADNVLVGNTSRKENLQSATLNRVQIDTITSESVNQINKSADLPILKKQMPKSPISAVKTGSKENLNVVDLLSDSENEEDNTNSIQNIHSHNLFGEKKDTVISVINNCNISRLEQRATRSQTRAESGFKQLNNSKLFDMQKERDNLQQLSGGPQLTDTNLIEDELIDIDQIEVEPLSVHDEIITQTTPKFIRSCIQKPYANNSVENILTNKVNNKEISNRMLEEISANFVLNSSIKNVSTEYKNVMIGQSHIDNANISESFFPVDDSTVTDTILLCKDGQSILNSGNTLNKTLLNKKRIVELKSTNIRCDDGRNDSKMLSFLNQPIVVRNKIKTPLKVKPTSGEKIDVLMSNDLKRPTRLLNNVPTIAQLFSKSHQISDEVIVIDDDDCRPLAKNKELPGKNSSKSLPLKVIEATHSSNSGNSKSSLHLDEKKTRDNKPWKMFGKTNNVLNLSSRNSTSQDSTSKIGNNSRISHTSNQFIKELDFEFDHSIPQTSLSELYNGVEEMHSFDNEELNSLIECSSLDNSETDVRENIINLDQGDSSVSGSDSTIGAFDTFAQITGVSLNSSTSKGIKSLNRNPKIANDGKDLNGDKGFVQSRDQISAVSVTGIPILQGVISDVMSKIDSNRVTTHKEVVSQNISSDEIVEISSDEEEIVPNPIQFSSNDPGPKKNIKCNNEIKTYKSNDEQLNKLHELESTFIIEVDDDSLETDSIGTKISEKNIPKEINTFVNVHKPDILNFKSCSFNINNMEIKIKDSKTKENKINCSSNNDNNLINTNIMKETKLIGSREKTEFKCLRGSLKLPRENPREYNKRVIKNIMASEDNMCINVEEEDINVKEATENKLESELMKRLKKPEIKRVNETKLNDEFEAEIMQRANKKNEIKKIIDVKSFDNKRIKDAEFLQRVKEIEIIKARDAEIKRAEEAELQKVQEAELKSAKEAEIQRVKEAEIQRAKEAEIQRAKEAEIQRAKEAEIQRAKEEEIQRVKEEEIQRAKEAEIQRVKEEEIQRAKEAEIQRAKEAAEIQRAKEVEIQRAKAAEIQRAREAEIQRAREAEIQRVKEVEIQRAKEAEIQRAKEAEIQRAKEAEIQRAKEIEIQRAKEIEIQRAEEVERREAEMRRRKVEEFKKVEEERRKIKEAETRRRLIEEEIRKKREIALRRAKEAEVKKFKEAEIKRAKEEADVRKAKEIEQRKAAELLLELKRKEENIAKIKEAELKKQKDLEFREAEIIRKSQLAKTKAKEVKMRKKTKKLQGKKLLKKKDVLAFDNRTKQLESIDNKKNITKKMKQKKQKSKNAIEYVVRKPKVNETTIMTRKRKSKTEENLKSPCTSYNHSKTEPSGNTPGNTKCSSVSLVSRRCRNSISLFNMPMNIVSKSRRKYKDFAISSTGPNIVSIRKTIISQNRKFAFKCRTRSSSLFKISRVKKVKSKFSYSPNETESAPKKKPIKKKPRLKIYRPIRSNKFIAYDIPAASGYNCNNTIELIKKEAAKVFMNKKMNSNVPVVLISSNEVAEYREKIAELKALRLAAANNDSSKKLDPKIVNPGEQIQKKIDVGEKPAPKKRGRKRRIDIENEKLQKSKKDNQANKKSQLPKVFEPPAKRTRRSKELRESDRFYSRKSVSQETFLSKKILKILLNKICGIKTFTRVERHVKYLSEENSFIIRRPVVFKEIKKKINTGQIRTLTELQVYIFTIITNAIAINISGNKVKAKTKKIGFYQFDRCWGELSTPGAVNREDDIQVQHNYYNIKKKHGEFNEKKEIYSSYYNHFQVLNNECKDVSVTDRKRTLQCSQK